MFPKVSVITVVYNCREALRSTLSSISGLDYDNLELIVIDGGSTDGTTDVISGFKSRIAYSVSEPDGGIYDAMNKGIAAATGDYLWFINAGDLVGNADVLRSVFHGRETYADIYYGDTIIMSESGNELGLRKKRLPRRLSWRSFRLGMVVCHQSLLVRRSIAGNYDLNYRYSSDIDWVMRCLLAAKSIENTRLILSRFVEGGASTQHRGEALRERFAIMRKYYGLWPTIVAHVGFVIDLFRPSYRPLAKP